MLFYSSTKLTSTKEHLTGAAFCHCKIAFAVPLLQWTYCSLKEGCKITPAPLEKSSYVSSPDALRSPQESRPKRKQNRNKQTNLNAMPVRAVHACNSSIQKAKQDDYGLEASLGYTRRPCFKKQPPNNSNNNNNNDTNP